MYNMYSLSRESNMRVLTTGAEEDRDTDAIRVVIRYFALIVPSKLRFTFVFVQLELDQ